MLNLYNTHIETLSIHRVGNKSRNESQFLSGQPFNLTDEIVPLMKEYFFRPFREKEENYFQFKAWKDAGIIKGYTALIDEAALGFEVSVFVSVKLDRQIDHGLSAFEAEIAQFPEVVDCWLMTGNRDYMMRVVTRNLIEFENFLVGRLTKISCVAEIESSIPLRRVKSDIARTL